MAESPTRPAVIGISFARALAPAPPSAESASAPARPRGPVEQAMLEIWREVLSVETVNLQADFFALGGDSLMATQVAARARQLFGVELDLVALFENPTLAGMATCVEAALRQGQLPPAPPLTRADRSLPLPLSFAQERMWFIHQLDPLNAAYNIAGATRLTAAFDVGALDAVLTALVARHEALRTTFEVVDGQPVQVIGAPAPFRVTVIDLSAEDAVEREARAADLARAAASAPFDLEHGPLLRVTLLRLAANDQVLAMSMHHLISDAWSMGVLGRELQALQPAQAGGVPARLPELPFQYADFAVWQRAWLRGAVLEEHMAYWRKQLAGVPVLALPADYPRPSAQTYRGTLETLELPTALVDDLRGLSQRAGVTFSMTLLAVFKVLLQRYTGLDDIAVGLPIANRRWLAVESLLGTFVNTLVVRTDLSGDPLFTELLARVRQVSLAAYTHQDLPFAKLVAELNPERSLSHTPLVQVVFNHINVPMPSAGPAGAQASAQGADYVALDRGAAQFDLSLTVIDLPGLRRVMVEYNTDLFEAATIQRLLGHYANLLRAVAAGPQRTLSALPMFAAAEREQLLSICRAAVQPYPAASLAELFEAQAARTPEAPALRCGAGDLSFAALNRRANQIAHHLLSFGAGPGRFIGVCVPRSFDLVAALLGVLKTGAAYVPLDPAYPAERLRFMLADSGAALVVTTTGCASLVANTPARLVVLDAVDFTPAPDTHLDRPVPLDAPAYMIYTSGSTGLPKGVVAPHHGAVNRLQWMWSTYPFAAGEVACQKTSLSFVDSVWETFGPLLQGVPLVVVPEQTAQDPAALVALLAAQGVTRLVVVPSLLRALLDTVPDLAVRLPRLKLWVVSGEALDRPLFDRFRARLPEAVLLNLYGSSEVAGDVTCFDSREPLTTASVPLGRPIANTHVYVLDAQRQPAPFGVPGEIFVGGAGLALGYHARPDLTAERFVPDPFGAEAGARLFKTGDLGRRLPDGSLLYLGRRDRQVKLRGQRLELDEIQAVLGAHPDVAGGAVTLRPGPAGDPRLVGYYVPRAEAAVSARDLRLHLAQHLPEAMLPAAWVALPALPRLPNGKVDEAALPAPEPATTAGSVRPRTLLESTLAQLWAETLGLPSVGVTDNFFELGGHSLLAASLFARLRATLGLDLPLALLFRAPTIEGLALAITTTGAVSAPVSALVPLQPRGARRPFFCVHPLGGGVGDYAALARHVHPEQPFYGLRAKGLEDDSQQSLSVEALAADYLHDVRAQQPHGPFRLGGYSSGGLIAFEMARQLNAAGETVELLALLDSYAPADRRAWHPAGLLNLLSAFPHWLDDFARLGRSAMLARLRRGLRAAEKRGLSPAVTDFIDQADLAQLPEQHRAFIQAHYRAILAYRPQPYAGAVTLFRARAQALSRAADPDKGWRPLAQGGLDVREFSGSHHTLLREPYAGALAKQLQTKLDEIER